MKPGELDRILEMGVLAISPYNTQPWRFRVSGEDVLLYVIRTKNFFLKLAGVSHMTAGFVLENLEQAARHHGYAMKTEILSDHATLDHPLARLRFEPDANGESDVEALVRRTTNRLPFERSPLRADHRRLLVEALSQLSNDRFRIELIDDERKETLADILAELELVRLRNPKMFREALEYIRVDPVDNERHRDRLDIETLGLGPRTKRALCVARRWPRLTRPLVWLLAASQREKKLEQLSATSGLLVFTVSRNDDYRIYIDLGRAVQRVLNLTTSMGIHSSPALSGHYLLSLIYENLEIFSSSAKDAILTCKRDLELLLKTHDRNVAFIARVGYASRVPPRALRRPVETFLLPPA